MPSAALVFRCSLTWFPFPHHPHPLHPQGPRNTSTSSACAAGRRMCSAAMQPMVRVASLGPLCLHLAARVHQQLHPTHAALTCGPYPAAACPACVQRGPSGAESAARSSLFRRPRRAAAARSGCSCCAAWAACCASRCWRLACQVRAGCGVLPCPCNCALPSFSASGPLACSAACLRPAQLLPSPQRASPASQPTSQPPSSPSHPASHLPAGPPWPHLALLVLLLLGSRSHWLPGLGLLSVVTLLATLHARGLRVILRVDDGGRLGLAVIRHGAPVQGVGPGGWGGGWVLGAGLAALLLRPLSPRCTGAGHGPRWASIEVEGKVLKGLSRVKRAWPNKGCCCRAWAQVDGGVLGRSAMGLGSGGCWRLTALTLVQGLGRRACLWHLCTPLDAHSPHGAGSQVCCWWHRTAWLTLFSGRAWCFSQSMAGASDACLFLGRGLQLGRCFCAFCTLLISVRWSSWMEQRWLRQDCHCLSALLPAACVLLCRGGARGVIISQPMAHPPTLPAGLAGAGGTGVNSTTGGGAASQGRTAGKGASRSSGEVVLKHYLGGPVGMPGALRWLGLHFYLGLGFRAYSGLLFFRTTYTWLVLHYLAGRGVWISPFGCLPCRDAGATRQERLAVEQTAAGPAACDFNPALLPANRASAVPCALLYSNRTAGEVCFNCASTVPFAHPPFCCRRGSASRNHSPAPTAGSGRRPPTAATDPPRIAYRRRRRRR